MRNAQEMVRLGRVDEATYATVPVVFLPTKEGRMSGLRSRTLCSRSTWADLRSLVSGVEADDPQLSGPVDSSTAKPDPYAVRATHL